MDKDKKLPPGPAPHLLAAEAPVPLPLRLPTIDSAALLAGANEVWIEHHGERYRLKHTRTGKLILTK